MTENHGPPEDDDRTDPSMRGCTKCRQATGEFLRRISLISPVDYFFCSPCRAVWSEPKIQPERPKREAFTSHEHRVAETIGAVEDHGRRRVRAQA